MSKDTSLSNEEIIGITGIVALVLIIGSYFNNQQEVYYDGRDRQNGGEFLE